MSDIYISGLASGIDTDGIIEKLMYLERRPQTLLQNKVDVAEGRKSVYSTLNAKIAALQDVVAQIGSLGSPFFRQTAAVSSQTTVAMAEIYGSQPSAGTYQLSVTALATAARMLGSAALYTGADAENLPASASSGGSIAASGWTVDPAQSLASQAGAFQTAPQAAGTLVINGTSIDWDDSMSLNEIVGRINSAGTGATARFDAVTQQLTVTSDETGADAALTLGQSAGNFWEAMQIATGTFTGTDAVAPDPTTALGDPASGLDETVTSGTFTLNGVTFYVDAATDSLQTVLSRINASQAGVTAAYDAATGTVSLTQKHTGSAAAITLGGTGDTSNLWHALKLSDRTPPTGGAADTVTGTDAQVSVNGAAAQSFADNTIQGLIAGVTVQLQGTGTTTITVGADTDRMVETLKEFVEQYNAVLGYINSKTAEERVKDPSTVVETLQGTFVSDRLFMDTKADLIEIVSGVVSGQPGTMNMLAQLGITTTAADFGKAGTLELDEDKLRAALAADPEGVEAIFNDATDGILTRMEAKLEAVTDVVVGQFPVTLNSLTEQIGDWNDQIQAMEDRLVQRETSIRMQFTAMETLVAELNSMSATFSSMLGQLTANK